MKKVLVCRTEVLPYSETFIRDQMLAASTWAPILVGRRAVAGLSLAELETRILFKSRSGILGKVCRRLEDNLHVALRRSVERLKNEAASVAHVHFGTDAVTYWPMIEALGLPMVVTLHGYDINISRDWWESADRSWSERQYPRRLLALARQPRVHFVAVSEAIRQRAISCGIASERISVHYIGVNLSRFAPAGPPIARRKPRILFVGRLVEKKGGEYLLRAYARVRETIPDAELVMVGDGPLREPLHRLAGQLRVPVYFRGSLSSTAVKDEIDQARVFCLPSVAAENGDAEGLGLVLLEAQACGVPVVTSAIGGATEGLIHGTTGFAFAEKDVATLAALLARVLGDDDLAASMSHAATEFVAEKFEIGACTRRLEALYDSVVE